MQTLAGELNMTVTDANGNESVDAWTISQSKSKFQKLGDMVVAEGASDQEFDFSDYMTSVEELWIISDQEITVKLDADSNYAITCKKLVISEGRCTKAYLSNSSGEDATVQFLIAG